MKQHVVIHDNDEDGFAPSINTDGEIINMIDMADCYYTIHLVYDINELGELEPLVVHGTWHDPKRPLYIKVTDQNGNIVFDGYGTDH